MEIDLTAEATTEPPDPNKPYVQLGGQWLLVMTDKADGVPDDLNLGAPDDSVDE